MLRTVLFLVLVVSVSCNPCRRVESLNISNGTKLDNGSIVHEGVEYPTESWYTAEEGNETVTLGCPCVGRRCLWKCCGVGEVFSGRECVASALPEAGAFSPPIFEGTERVAVEAPQRFFYMYSTELCETRYLVDSAQPDENVYVQQNGDLVESVDGRLQRHGPGHFCVEMMLTAEGSARLVAAPCHATENPLVDDAKYLYVMYAVGLLLSTPFLLVTFLVYAVIPELRNLHGLCLMAYCAGLIVGYPLLAYLKMESRALGEGKAGCIVIAFTVYYGFQSSFFWLNVMCFDIWRTFRGYRGGSSKKRQEQRRFAMYGAYAWGAPLVLVSILAYMQFGGLPAYMRPGMADMKCWFEDWKRELVYFYTPVLVLVVCNTALFSVTACRIRAIKQETAILKGSESARSDRLKKDKQRYALYLKLFMVMGVNWSVELLSFAVGGSNWYWIVVDLSNVMLGFFIFLIFVWKKKVCNLLRKRWYSIRGACSATDSMGKWATRTSSAPTEDTRVSSEETGLKMKEVH